MLTESWLGGLPGPTHNIPLQRGPPRLPLSPTHRSVNRICDEHTRMMPGSDLPPRVASPAPLPSAAAHQTAFGGAMFANSMHTFVHGCSWGSFGNLASPLGGSPFGSSSNLAALGGAAQAQAAAAAGAHSPAPPPGLQQTPPVKQQQHGPAAAAAAQQQQQHTPGAGTPPLAAQRRESRPMSFMRSVFSAPSLDSTSA